MACQNKRQVLTSALAYMGYILYDARPTYELGECLVWLQS